jgi:hypothetical protein
MNELQKAYNTEMNETVELIKQLLNQLSAHETEFNSNPGWQHWGQVGDIGRIKEVLETLVK